MRVFVLFFIFCGICFGGAGFESESYLIWISSKCPAASTTCRDVSYTQTNKSGGKSITIHGGEPIVGNMSGGLIGYKFLDAKNGRLYELSINLNSEYTLYVRTIKGKEMGKSFKQEKVTALKEEEYRKKIAKVKK